MIFIFRTVASVVGPSVKLTEVTFVTTGTHTGMVFTERGVTIRAEYGPLGRVEVSFPA